MNWDSILNIAFDILTYGIFIYSTLLLLSYIAIAIFSIGETRKYIHKNSFTDYRVLASSIHAPSVSILAPAYNEGMTIVENIRSLLSIYYTNLEVIVINDGSKDDCLQKMIQAYELEKIDYFVDYKIKTKDVRGVYKSRNPIYHKLLVVDKVNGGKADALNVGINISSNKYLVCIDVDCILEQDALLKMVKPFLEQTDERVIASGGVVRIANSCIIEDGRLVKVKLAEDYLPRMQILEYIRAFILGRMAWSRLNGLMLISGAFGAFDKEIAIKCGGYDHNTVGEDMELVVRMRRYMEERNEKYRVTYIPDPLCWTEAPSSFDILGRQRNRWTRGTIETLKFHKKMFFNPKYGLLGMLSYPYWFFFEMCAPVIEFFGFVCFFLFAAFGMLDWGFFFAYFLFIVSFGYLYSAFAILMEVITYHQYKRRIDILILLLTALTEPFYFHPFVVWSAIKGYIDYFRKKKSWGEMTRQGFAKKTADTPQVIPVVEEVVVVPEIIEAPVPSVTEESVIKISWYKRKVAPIINGIPDVLFQSFRYYLGHILALLLLFVIARAIEIGLDYKEHGEPEFFKQVILYGLAKDIAFMSSLAIWCYLPFTLLYVLSKKVAHVTFIILGSLTVLIQVALSQYFIQSFVPLGADLWSYSWADIQQTVGASGGLTITSVIGLFFVIGLSLFILIKLPRRLMANDGIVVFFILLITVAGIRDLNKVTEALLPGREYSNNLSLNKSYYFYSSSYNRFFPKDLEEDIYRDDYQSDGILADTEIDTKNYPFLHRTDSTKNVLGDFFSQEDSMPPNIVILMVEGLGRAFSNQNAYLGSFTPFLDSLSGKSLYWENFLSTGGRTFTVLPSLLASLPFGNSGFTELGDQMPAHLSIANLLRYNGYKTAFFYGGDASFDNMKPFLKKTGVENIFDETSFPTNGYQRLPKSSSGFSWGYDDASLYRHMLSKTTEDSTKPHLSVILTVATHSPFLINDQQEYIDRFEKRMGELKFSAAQKRNYRNYTDQYASILYADQSIKEFINAYSKRQDFKRTVFIITGDHRMPEIPMSTKLDRYHVPMMIYSPMLNKAEKFAAVSSHFDIAPTITAWLKYSYGLTIPNITSWLGTGIDTGSVFRNNHSIPLKQTKPELIDFVRGSYMLNGDDLFKISSTMDLEPDLTTEKKFQMKSSFNQFKRKNLQFTKERRLIPDSLVQKYTRY